MYYKGINKDKLIDLCEKRGLGSTGTKDALIARLLENDKTKENKTNMFSQTPIEIEPDLMPSEATDSSIDGNFFLHIKSANLSNYFTYGFFYPLALEESEIYKLENRAKDILSYFNEYIIVGKSPINEFENSDVLVELVLNEIQVNDYEKSGLFYIGEPVPVSRVKFIHFKTATSKATFLSSIKTFPDSYIPSSICKILPVEYETSAKINLENIILPKNVTLADWKPKLDLFDRVLGLFAFIKNASVFYAERENKFENYSAGFLSTLNLINSTSQLSSYKENAYLRPLLHYRNLEINSAQRVIFKSAIEKVYNNDPFDLKIAIEILENSVANEYSKNGELADTKELTNLFKQLEKLIISYKEVLKREIIGKNQNLPALALLFLSMFPNKSRQHTDKQSVRNIFIQNEYGVPLNVAEYLLGFLGLYYGYKNMIKEDTNLQFSDSTFELLAKNTQSIKFKLNSYLDRFILESIFQFTVQQKVLNDSFEFLNWSNISDNIKPVVPASTYQYDYFDRSTKIMGQNIISVVRQNKTEKLFDKVSNQYPDKIEYSTYLAAFIAKYFYLDKRHILDFLKNNKNQYPMDELENIIDLDRKSKRK